MLQFKVTGQSYKNSNRIAKVVPAKSEADALFKASQELENYGFYVLDIKAI